MRIKISARYIKNTLQLKRNSLKYFLNLIYLSLLIFILFSIADKYNIQKFNTFEQKIINVFNNEYCSNKIKNNLQKLETNLVNESSIFFIETRCHTTTQHILNKRQACAVESAAITNPHVTVYVLFPSEVPFNLNDVTSHVNALLKYSNIKLRHISMVEYVKGTPLESWYSSGILKKSRYPLEHASDVLRLLTLWKFGGIYLDLDFVILRSLDGLTPFAALENDGIVSNAAIASPLYGIGHNVLSMVLEELTKTFRGDLWGANGPILLTYVLYSVCNIGIKESIRNMTKDRCKGFNIYPQRYFYPLSHNNWRKYFTILPEEITEVMTVVQNSYAVHLWNKLSHNYPIDLFTQQPYVQIAKKFCPQVYKISGTEM